MDNREAAAVGCLLGTAVGDALGLPAEGLTARRQARWYADFSRYRLLPGRGMCSDDTDHACMVAQALAASRGDARRFASSLAWRLRFWFLGLPAGIGFATLRAIFKLWLFIPPRRSGVWSAGNGPAMRSALLGIAFAGDEKRLVEHVAANTRITHTDPKAEAGALAVALAARSAMRRESPEAFLRDYSRLRGEQELKALLEKAAASVSRKENTAAFAASIGCAKEVTGYMYHSVPVALHAAWSHPDDLETALIAAVRCGGDADTVAAITGGIAGAGVGKAGITPQRLEHLWDWPRGAHWMERAAANAIAAVDTGVGRALPILAPGLALRNLFLLMVVLAHGFRRLGPPY